MHTIKRLVASPWIQCLGVTAVLQLATFFTGVFFNHTFAYNVASAQDILSHTSYWDGGWFSGITFGHAYSTNSAAAVFYPLFPMAVNAVHFLGQGHIPYLAAGLIVNVLATWFAIVALLKITEQFVGEKYRWWGVALFVTSPAAMFMHQFYAEAIFCALAFWAYLFALRRQWLWMAISLALLTAVKLPAVLVIGLCSLEFMRAYDWKPRKIIRPQALYFLISPLGFFAYGLYMLHLRHDFLAMFHGYHATTDWSYHVFNPDFVWTILRAAHGTLLFIMGRGDLAKNLVNAALPFTGLFLLGLVSLYAIVYLRGKTLPLAIASLVSIAFFTINSNVISVHRYLLPSVALYVIPAMLIKKFPKYTFVAYIAVYAGAILQTTLMSLFISGHFAG